MAALKCLGNCVTCEHLANGEVDEIVCPVRVSMIYMKSVDVKVSKVLSMLESSNSNMVKPLKSALVVVEEDEVQDILGKEEDE